MIASLPASENKGFREEFDTEYEDVQLTAYLATLTKSANILNEVGGPLNNRVSTSFKSSPQLVDKHIVLTASREDRGGGPRRRGMMGRPTDFDRFN